ncbi:MAG TPA: phage tail sheath subtilisin-like domain-containing protein [Cyanophyceae cyanobacterium]
MPTTYLSPGVYVEEVPSAIQPIAGVGTSTAGFIGVVPDEIYIPTSRAIQINAKEIGKGNGTETTFDLPEEHRHLINKTKGSFQFRVGGVVQSAKLQDKSVSKGDEQSAEAGDKPDSDGVVQVVFSKPPKADAVITGDYSLRAYQVRNELIGRGKKKPAQPAKNPPQAENPPDEDTFKLEQYPRDKSALDKFKFLVNGAPVQISAVEETVNDQGKPVGQVKFTTPPPEGSIITGNYEALFPTFKVLANPGEVKLCTNFSEYKKFFGDFSTDPDHNTLTQAVYGFFNNGGTRCYVVRITDKAKIDEEFLERTFEPIDEIAIVAAPGLTDDPAIRSAILIHCQQKTQDRFAIFDSPEEVEDPNGFLDLQQLNPGGAALPEYSNYAAFYFPWIQVFNPALKTINPDGDGRVFVPPSGYLAGIYARVDNTRGVFKAPANEPILGAFALKYKITKNQQDGLNPQGVNCIRDLNGNIRVWGARTIGGDANGEYKYINVRRTMLFIRESIDEGTQWAVFEPNDSRLWTRITLNVTAFLSVVWRNGALFGNTPQEAFYVKCDEETNPPEIRELGQVITEVGVAIVRPAEFVIFRVTQWAGPSK